MAITISKQTGDSFSAAELMQIIEFINGTDSSLTSLTTTVANKVNAIVGKGLSTHDLTAELYEKLSNCTEYTSDQIDAAIAVVQNRLDALVGTSLSNAIDTFREIETFLTSITDQDTLVGLMNTLRTTLENDYNTKITALSQTVSSNDSNAVHKTGIETIDGAKTFSVGAYCENEPDDENSYTNKKYVDNNFLPLEGDKTVRGVITYDQSPYIPDPADKLHGSNKQYTDSLTYTMFKAWLPVFDESKLAKGLASTSEYAPTSPTANDCYLVVKTGTVFGVSATQGQVIYWNGTIWVTQTPVRDTLTEQLTALKLQIEAEFPADELVNTSKKVFCVADNTGNIGMQYSEDEGFDAALVSDHFKSLLGLDSAGMIVDSTGENVIGKYKYLLSGVVTYLPVYEQKVSISAASITAGTDITQVFSFLDYIDYQKYVILHNITVKSNSDEIVYNNPFTKTKVTNTAGGLQFVLTPAETISTAVTIEITLRYVKTDDGADYVGLEFSITDSSIADVDALGLSIAPLKFDKEIAMTVSIDDNSSDAYDRFFALFNGRELAATSNGNIYTQSQWLSGNLTTIKGKGLSTVSYAIPLFTDGCGLDKRYKFTAIFMPQSVYNSVPRCLMASSDTTLYSGSMNCHYTNYKEMYMYGNSLSSHNCNENSSAAISYLGTTFTLPQVTKGSYTSMPAGFEMDDTLYKFFGLPGCRMHAIPDGDTAGYGHAARLFKKFSCYTKGSPQNSLSYWLASDAYNSLQPYIKWFTGSTSEYNNIDRPPYNSAYAAQFYVNSIGRNWFDTAFSTFVSDFTTELAVAGKENRKYMVVGTHDAVDAKITMLRDFATSHGKAGTDVMWVPSQLEFFDYYRIKKYSKIRVYKLGDTFHVKVYMPTADANGNALEFMETTLKANLTANSVVSFPDSSYDKKLINVTSSTSKGIINLYGDSRILTTIDTIIERVRATSTSYVRTTYLADLTYFVSQLKPSLQTYYNNIISTL